MGAIAGNKRGSNNSPKTTVPRMTTQQRTFARYVKGKVCCRYYTSLHANMGKQLNCVDSMNGTVYARSCPVFSQMSLLLRK